MRARALTLAALLAAAAALAACGDQPQALGSKTAGPAAYQGTGTQFVAEGWKAGDETSWQTQMRVRAQGQNEYSRTTSQ